MYEYDGRVAAGPNSTDSVTRNPDGGIGGETYDRTASYVEVRKTLSTPVGALLQQAGVAYPGSEIGQAVAARASLQGVRL